MTRSHSVSGMGASSSGALRRLIRPLAVWATMWVAACGGDGGTGPEPTPQANRPPVAAGSLPAQTMTAGESVTVSVAAAFSDPDGDALTYTANSSDTGVASVALSGTNLTVTAVSAGNATVTVTARDPAGLSASASANVTVTESNRPPSAVLPVAPPQTVGVGDVITVDVASFFNDPDGDPLTYSATSANTSVATVSVTGSVLSGAAVGEGSTVLMVTATDPEGLFASLSVPVTVVQPNRPPAASGPLPPQSVQAGNSVDVDVSAYFSDPDGDALTYTASSSSEDVVTASVTGSAVTVTGVAEGMATVTVTASDPGDLTASLGMDVTVEGGGDGTQTYQTGQTIPTLPTGFWTPDLVSGASFEFSGGQVTMTFNSGGFIEEAGIRYTCAASGGCRIEGRVVTQGTIAATGGGGGSNGAPEVAAGISDATMDPGDRRTVDLDGTPPSFTDPDGDPLTYTATSSNTGVVTVSLAGTVLEFVAVNPGQADVSVTATDPGGLSATLTFGVTVMGGSVITTHAGACTVGLTLGPGGSCDVGSDRFQVLPDGRGRMGFITAGTGITINRFSASRISGTNNWRIDAVP